MPTKLELLQEAYKRGILPSDKLALYNEAVKRGLIGGIEKPEKKVVKKLSKAEQWRQFRHEGATALSEESKKRVAGTVRPILEVGGLLTGGAVVGGTTVGVGTVAGAAGGYAMGTGLADSKS